MKWFFYTCLFFSLLHPSPSQAMPIWDSLKNRLEPKGTSSPTQARVAFDEYLNDWILRGENRWQKDPNDPWWIQQEAEKAQKIAQEIELKEKQELENQKRERVRKREEENRKRLEEEKKRIDLLANEYRPILQEILQDPHSRSSQAVLDRLSQIFFQDFVAKRFQERLVFMAIGNSERELTSNQERDLKKLTEVLIKRGSLLIYDRHSKSAQFIESIVPAQYRLGISSAFDAGFNQSLPVSNPYLRMELMLKTQRIIFSPDSLVGIGLLIEGFDLGGTEFFTFDPEEAWVPGLSKWSQGFESSPFEFHINWYSPANREDRNSEVNTKRIPNLGIHYRCQNEPKPLSTAYFLSSRYHFSSGHDRHEQVAIPPFEIEAMLRYLKPQEVVTVFNSAKTFIDRSERLEEHLNQWKTNPNSAVLFGSSRGNPRYEPLVFKFSSYLAKEGWALSTGGSGGFMKVANQAAHQAGVPSVGIPLGADHRSQYERITASEFHSLTLPTSDYSERIPFLLQNQQLILLAPGGSGTMKELATAIIKVAADESNKSRFVFISSEYFGPFCEWLKKLPLPESFQEKIKLIDDENISLEKKRNRGKYDF